MGSIAAESNCPEKDGEKLISWIYGSKIESKTITLVRNLKPYPPVKGDTNNASSHSNEGPVYNVSLLSRVELVTVRNYL